MIPLMALLLAASGEPVGLHYAAARRDARLIREAFVETNHIYREAADAEGEKREELYREAARRYAAIAFLGTRRSNGYVLYNLGNARFRLGEYGRAIAAYRRAEVLLPRHGATRRNLAFARENAPGGEPGAGPHPAAAAFFFWHYAISLAEAEALAAFFFLALVAALSVRLFVSAGALYGSARARLSGAAQIGGAGRTAEPIITLSASPPARPKPLRRGEGPWMKRLRTAAIALGVLAGVFVLSSAAKLSSRSRPWAVVTAEVVPVKSEPAGRAIELFPLREGAEVRVIGRAGEGGEWTRIEAGRDRRGWVETRAVEVLSEAPASG